MRAKVDARLKKESEKIFAELGLTTDAAITLFLNQVKRHCGLPFAVVLNGVRRDEDDHLLVSDEVRDEVLSMIYDD